MVLAILSSASAGDGEGGAPPSELQLGPTGELQGQVLDADGRPLAGCPLTILVDAGARSVVTAARTSSGGRFVLDGLPAGNCTLRVRPREGVTYIALFEHRIGAPPLEVRLPRGTDVSGSLLDRTKAEGESRVALAPLLNSRPSPLAPAFLGEVTPDGGGLFRFSRVPPGRYLLLGYREQVAETDAGPPAAPSSYVAVRQRLDVSTEPVSGLVLELPATLLLGEVRLRQGGAPVGRATLLFRDIEAPQSTELPLRFPCPQCVALVHTDGRGRFTAPVLPAGTYSVRVSLDASSEDGATEVGLRLLGSERELPLEVTLDGSH